MAPATVISLVFVAYLVIVGLLYMLFVPGSLALVNFVFIAAVVLMLAIVVVLKYRRSGAVTSMDPVLYDTEHPPAKK
jgi:hypothetical protein